ncbi:hypothetical protein AAMO2058_000541600 [Amorphochlora amoebiformis]
MTRLAAAALLSLILMLYGDTWHTKGQNLKNARRDSDTSVGLLREAIRTGNTSLIRRLIDERDIYFQSKVVHKNPKKSPNASHNRPFSGYAPRENDWKSDPSIRKYHQNLAKWYPNAMSRDIDGRVTAPNVFIFPNVEADEFVEALCYYNPMRREFNRWRKVGNSSEIRRVNREFIKTSYSKQARREDFRLKRAKRVHQYNFLLKHDRAATRWLLGIFVEWWKELKETGLKDSEDEREVASMACLDNPFADAAGERPGQEYRVDLGSGRLLVVRRRGYSTGSVPAIDLRVYPPPQKLKNYLKIPDFPPESIMKHMPPRCDGVSLTVDEWEKLELCIRELDGAITLNYFKRYSLSGKKMVAVLKERNKWYVRVQDRGISTQLQDAIDKAKHLSIAPETIEEVKAKVLKKQIFDMSYANWAKFKANLRGISGAIAQFKKPPSVFHPDLESE